MLLHGVKTKMLKTNKTNHQMRFSAFGANWQFKKKTITHLVKGKISTNLPLMNEFHLAVNKSTTTPSIRSRCSCFTLTIAIIA